MEPMLITTVNLEDLEEPSDEDLLVQDWRASQLRRLGLPATLADTFAQLVDWHEVAKLVERGCTPQLALRIVR
jgi:hypothetical protein